MTNIFDTNHPTIFDNYNVVLNLEVFAAEDQTIYRRYLSLPGLKGAVDKYLNEEVQEQTIINRIMGMVNHCIGDLELRREIGADPE